MVAKYPLMQEPKNITFPHEEPVNGIKGIPKSPSSKNERFSGSNRPVLPSRSTVSTVVEEDTITQFSESSSVQTTQMGTSSRLLVNEGIAYHQKGLYSMALKSFFSALKSKMIDKPKDHPFVANTLANIGATYLRQGCHQKAAEALNEALEMMQRLRNQCNTTTEKSEFKLSGVLNNLGTVYFLQGNSKLSLEYYREALKDARAHWSSSKEVTNALHNIGRLFALQKEWDASLNMLNESLRMEKELYGRNSMAVVDTLNLIGFVHFSTEAYDAATVVFAEALSVVHANCGLVHEKVAISLLNVGMVMERQGRLDEALHTFSTARDVFERIGMGNDHRGVRVARESIDKISAVLQDEGSISEEQCIAIGQNQNCEDDENAELRDEPHDWQADDSSIVDSRDIESRSSEDTQLLEL
jgi:tetratricopeptide (TPR) repeat protein